MSTDKAPQSGAPTIHASAVSVAGRGLLILGASGSGKSGLALDMMSRGAVLIADDRVRLMRAEAGQGALGLTPGQDAAGQAALERKEPEQRTPGQVLPEMAAGQAASGEEELRQQPLFLTPQPPATLIACCPPALSGRIEARGLGILNATPAGPTPLALVVDLDRTEPDRLPPQRHIDLLGVRLPLVLGAGAAHLGSALRQMLLAGRSE